MRGAQPTAVRPNNSEMVNGMTGADEEDEEEIEYEESFLVKAWEHGDRAPATHNVCGEELLPEIVKKETDASRRNEYFFTASKEKVHNL